MPRFAFLGLATVILWSAAAGAQEPDSVQAALLHKGKDAIVHAAPLRPGYLITFVVPSTGVMKPLLKAEPHKVEPHKAEPHADSATATRPPGVRQPRPAAAEFIAGAAVDDERLYVVTATRVFGAAPAADEDVTKKAATKKAATKKGSGRPPASAGEAAQPRLIGHQFRLHAYSLKDGAALMGEGYELPLVSDDPKATEPPDTTKLKETLGRGPIELVPGGLKCRGTTVIFEGSAVKSLEVKGRQFTPPPGFFQRDPSERIG